MFTQNMICIKPKCLPLTSVLLSITKRIKELSKNFELDITHFSYVTHTVILRSVTQMTFFNYLKI